MAAASSILESLCYSRHGANHPRKGRLFKEGSLMINEGIVYEASQDIIMGDKIDHSLWSQVGFIDNENNSEPFLSPKIPTPSISSIANPDNNGRIVIKLSSYDYRATKYKVILVAHNKDNTQEFITEYNSTYKGLVIDLNLLNFDMESSFYWEVSVYAINSI